MSGLPNPNPPHPSLPSILSPDPKKPNTTPSFNNFSRPSFNGNGNGDQNSPNQGIRLPPISFLSTLPNLGSNKMGPPTSMGVPRLLNDNTSTEDQQSSIVETSGTNVDSTLPPKSAFQTASANSSNNNNDATPTPSNTSAINTPPSIPSISTFTNSLHKQKYHDPIIDGTAVKLKEEITKPDIDEENDDEIIKYYETKYGISDITNEEKHDILQHERRARIEKAKNPNYKTYLCYSIIKRLNTIPPSNKQSASLPSSKGDADSSKKVEPNSTQFSKRKIIVDNDDVLQYASKFPRRHLGSILYTPSPTRASHKELSIMQNTEAGDKADEELVPLIPELRDYINCIITVRIPSQHITNIRNNRNYINRALWGADVYTDDSDILLILKHNGFLPNTEKDEMENDETDGVIEKKTPGNLENSENVKQTVNNFRHFINIIGGDVHVDLIILPPLVKYQGIYRNGINSRSWTTGHDGMSLAVYGVRYGELGSAVESVNSVEFKKRKLAEVLELEAIAGEGEWKVDRDAWTVAKHQIRSLKEEKEKKKNDSTV